MLPVLATLASLALGAGTAAAAAFSYQFSGVPIGGTLDGTAFAAGPYRISGTADTSTIQQSGAFYSVALQQVSVEAHFGTVALTSPVNLFMDNDQAILGLSRGASGGVHLIEAELPDTFVYELKTAVKLAGLEALFMQWAASFGPVMTTAGELVFDNGPTFSTFTATPVLGAAPIPLPAGGLLLIGAVTALAAFRHRARR
jgi:hypothetical protein